MTKLRLRDRSQKVIRDSRDAKIARKRDFNTRQQQRFREIEIALKFSGTHVSEGTILYT